MGEETRAVADTGSEGQGPCAGDPAAVHKGLGDAYVEDSHSESWEPSAPEASAEPFDTQSPQAGPQLGKEPPRTVPSSEGARALGGGELSLGLG